MASIWSDSRNGTFLIKFRLGRRAFTRSCRTTKRDKAERIKATVEETIALLNTGRLTVPDAVEDVGLWVMSGGRSERKPAVPKPHLAQLGETCDAYTDAQRSKADTTLACEQVHIRHLKRLLGQRTKLDALRLNDLQAYVDARGEEKNRFGRTIAGQTVRKELVTFLQIWSWAKQRGLARHPCPLKDSASGRWLVSLPKPAEPEEFMTWSEVERRIARSGEGHNRKDLWRFLYLDEHQRDELLEYVRRHAGHPFVYPMFAFAAYTGARRSEIRRSVVDDFRFEDGIVIIRERKRRKDRSGSLREIPLHPRLRAIMEEWFAKHPGGPYTIASPLAMARRSTRLNFEMLTADEAHWHFKAALAGSKWEVVRGFHVLRHSFGAITTRKGVPMNVIAKWMGHTTDEMMRHYQHLFPQDERAWMERLA